MNDSNRRRRGPGAAGERTPAGGHAPSGRPTPRLIASVLPTSESRAREDLRRSAAEGADAAELRLDAGRLESGPLIEQARGLGLLTIVACRRSSDGGGWDGTEEDRIALLERAARCGADFVDIEEDAADLARFRRPERTRLIVSHHDRCDGRNRDGSHVRAGSRTTAGDVAARADAGDLAARARRLAGTAGASLIKIVTMAADLGDNLVHRELLALAVADTSLRGRLISFAMGRKGIPSRLLSLAWGSAATYLAADPLLPAAEGQVGLAEAVDGFRILDIRPETPLYGIAGAPLTHSLSPAMHNAALRACGIEARYVPFETDSLEEFLLLVRALPLAGYSVTVPHKIAAVRAVDELDGAARAIGAINTVVRRSGRLIGYNTDAEGGIVPLRRRMNLGSARILLLGAGGAARALAHALVSEGAEVNVWNRTPGRAAELARLTGARIVETAELERAPRDILVNATSAGMTDPEELPLPAPAISGRLVYDLVYRREGRTRLLREAEARGIPVVDGLEMLLEQALLQFRLWFDPTPALLRTAREAMTGVLGEVDPSAGR